MPLHDAWYKCYSNCVLTVFWCFPGVEKGCLGNKWVGRFSSQPNTLGIFNMNIALTTVNILIYKGNYDIFLTEAFNMVVCISNNNDLSIYWPISKYLSNFVAKSALSILWRTSFIVCIPASLTNRFLFTKTSFRSLPVCKEANNFSEIKWMN